MMMVYRKVIAKCLVWLWYLKDNRNRPHANELIEALAITSPGINGGVLLTYVWNHDCIKQLEASPRERDY